MSDIYCLCEILLSKEDTILLIRPQRTSNPAVIGGRAEPTYSVILLLGQGVECLLSCIYIDERIVSTLRGQIAMQTRVDITVLDRPQIMCVGSAH